jgi:phosphohistidine swiveling domain-containing protein
MLYFPSNPEEGKKMIGGKGSNLIQLHDLGLNVPKFTILSAELFLEITEKGNLSKEQAIQKIRNYQNESLVSEITSYFSDCAFIAVRSSCLDEDGIEHSYAGQFETHLYIKPENVLDSIKEIWISVYADRVTAYREEKGIKTIPAMAVILQEMIDPDVSGVAFGANPITGNRREKIISSVYGVGEGIVSGELNSDNYFLSPKEIKKEITTKEFALKQNEVALRLGSGGTEKVQIQSEFQNKESLNDQQIKEISKTLDVLKAHYIFPQDIEFAYKNGLFYILQARPITTMNQLPDLDADFIVWDNSNIIESYPGVTTPLTFSFILKIYESVYKQFSEMMGIKQSEIEEHKEVYANMLGLINGRVYYNLKSWYKILSLLPGYSLNAEFMEKMMGVKERFELKDYKPGTKFQERLRVVNMIRIMIKNLRALPKIRIEFQAYFNQVMRKYDQIDLKNSNATELMNYYYEFEQTLLKKWKAPLVNDFFAMIYFGVLQKMTAKLESENKNIHNDLLCGERNIISTEPIKRTIALAIKINSDSISKALFLNETPETIWKELGHLNSNLKKEIDEYIDAFGERCVGELKLETITYKQQPLYYIQILKSYIEQGVNKDYHDGNSDLLLRSEAEKEIKKAFKGKFIKGKLYNYFLVKSRDLVSSRENLRFERTRAFGMIRKIFIEIGNNFYSEGLLEDPADIFHLTKEEIFDYIKGTSVNFNLKELIEIRKKQFNSFEDESTNERIKTHGICYLGNDFKVQISQETLNGDLKGIGCCAGRITGKVRVVKSPYEVNNLNGDILVTSSTDPGWVTLFPTASAILVERGSLLSHSAIVSREMGKPCIVGITGLLSILKTGDLVEMDGSTGDVKIIERADAN